ncbi:glycoside hydrolase family 13 protein [Kytococcus sedentarius]|uniref:glycoside hydrolase family 13 protein n=1 Tax=Kytococcus sedentarius TaxID=1276 RepID=UPI00195069FA|nr:glycoside hydrolase family 13 protein [Kytococcus sedentarius]QRO87965.1 glycoside hydrolase family 13 protein [Kytococcus sedentarius]
MGRVTETSLRTGPIVHSPSAGTEWWRHAVIYQIYPRSWADADGDGLGDLPGITSRLEHLAALGVDAVWVSPFYVSPMKDAGYDVTDYRDVDPIFGTLDDADAFIARAHELGLRVIVDLVPNHSSDQHEWFQQALAAGPGSPERERYLFRDGSGPDGSEPPNDWGSVFGGAAWTRVDDGQWYLHLFDSTQPDFNWRNPEVRDYFEDVLRFWLDRGVDGFRVDVAHSLVKAEGLPDFAEVATMAGGSTASNQGPMWDQDEVHEVYRRWHRVLEEYEGDRVLCAEAWVPDPERLARYVREDEMHQAFNFDFLETPWRADDLRACIERSFATLDAVGAPTTWVLSNHDVVRHASRLGLTVGQGRPNGIAAEDPQPDAELGLRRARAATTMMLALPGSSYLYYGEELGLPEHTAMDPEVRQDPAWHRTRGTAEEQVGRDGCRVPMPWEAEAPGHGFGPSEQTWLPQPEAYVRLAVDQQTGVEGSTLELYRRMLGLRHELGTATGGLAFVNGFGEDVLALEVGPAEAPVTVVTVTAGEGVDLPEGAEVLLDSLTGGPSQATRVERDHTVWVRGSLTA